MRKARKKHFAIIRGLPGSGKSRYAQELLDHDASGCVFSADDFFYFGEEYRFDVSRIGEAHADCARRVFRAFQQEVSTVILANTFSQRWEYAHYIKAAELAGYSVTIYEIPCRSREEFLKYHARNVHDVPRAVAAEMWLRWEPDPRAILRRARGELSHGFGKK